MAKRRGFFAELQHQSQLAAKRHQQEAAAVRRAQDAARRDAERAQREWERAVTTAARADEKTRKELERQAKGRQVQAQEAKVASLNADLAGTYEDLDSLLAATFDVDDFVDLQTLKIGTVEHPPFDPGPLGTPIVPPQEPIYPPEPVFVPPPTPTGIFASKKKHQAAVDQANADHAAVHERWRQTVADAYSQYVAEHQHRTQAEADRQTKFGEARGKYVEECQQREADAATRDAELEKLINGLAFDVEEAVDEYVGIVLSNSVYPDSFPVKYDHGFDLKTRELRLTVTIPDPASVPSVREYRYVKAKDEIVGTSLTVKAQKDRYASIVHQVAVRTLHEVFEADRSGKIHSIALTVGADRISPATGLPEIIPLVQVGADRDTFVTFDLVNVVPQATLVHLGAALSKSPFDLIPADTGRGVRARGN